MWARKIEGMKRRGRGGGGDIGTELKMPTDD
jgi:hypothetical protein